MRTRCNCKNHKDYILYGKKGIKICKEWDDFWVFVNDMGDKPTKDHTLDRIDNDKGYNKENCRWATKKEQTLNRRISSECLRGHKWTKENTIIEHNGKNKTRRCRICFKNRILKNKGGGNG